jgi:acyl-CoA thioesterase FadM
MGKLSKLTEEKAVTAEMNILYKRPVPVDQEIVVEGWQEEEKGRNRFRVGEIRDAQGNLLARGTGRFVAIGEKHFERVRVAQ